MFLAFTRGGHPIVRGKGRGTFLTARFPKFVSLSRGQLGAYRQEMLAA